MAALRSLRTASRIAHPFAQRSFTTSSRLSDLARMQIIGRLGGPPEPTQTSTGKTVLRYAIATNYGSRENRSTSWFNVSCFAEEGEGLGQLMAGLEKGTLVYVEADSQMRTYDGEDGKKHRALNLVQRNLQILARPLNRNALDEADPANAAATG